MAEDVIDETSHTHLTWGNIFFGVVSNESFYWLVGITFILDGLFYFLICVYFQELLSGIESEEGDDEEDDGNNEKENPDSLEEKPNGVYAAHEPMFINSLLEESDRHL